MKLANVPKDKIIFVVGNGEFTKPGSRSMHGKVLERLYSTCLSLGIKIVQMDEEYTSQKCPRCHDQTEYVNMRVKYCHFHNQYFHRDLMASQNLGLLGM